MKIPFLYLLLHLVLLGLIDAPGTLFCPSSLISTCQCLCQTIGSARLSDSGLLEFKCIWHY